MKKIFSMLFLFVLCFALVGCDMLGGTENKITVKFDTQGGEKIANQELTIDTIAEFKLPADPTKEGFSFTGWFLDKECENKFDNIPAKNGTITLYAGWIEESKAPTSIVGEWGALGTSFNFKSDGALVVDISGMPAEGTYTIDKDGNVNASVTISNQKMDFTGKFAEETLKVTIENQEMTLVPIKNVEYIKLPDLSDVKGFDGTTTVAIKGVCSQENTEYDEENNKETTTLDAEVDGEVSVSVKVESLIVKEIKELKGEIIINASVEKLVAPTIPTELPFNEVEVKISVNDGFLYLEVPEMISTMLEMPTNKFSLNLDELVKIAEAQIPAEAVETTPEELVKELNKTINQYVAMLGTLGINEQTITNLINVLKKFLPVKTEKGNTVTYTLTEEQLDGAIDDLVKFATDNINVILAVFASTEASDTTEAQAEILAQVNTIAKMVKDSLTINKCNIVLTKENDKIKTVKAELDVEVNLDLSNEEYDVKYDIALVVTVDTTVNSYEPTVTFTAFEGFTDVTEMLKAEMGEADSYPE